MAGVAAGSVDRWIGSKACLMVLVGGAYPMRRLPVPASGALVARLSRPNLLDDFFGLFAVSGTGPSFAGRLAIHVVTSIFHQLPCRCLRSHFLC